PSSAAHWGRESVAWVQSKPMIRSSPAFSCCMAFLASISGKGQTAPLVWRGEAAMGGALCRDGRGARGRRGGMGGTGRSGGTESGGRGEGGGRPVRGGGLLRAHQEEAGRARGAGHDRGEGDPALVAEQAGLHQGVADGAAAGERGAHAHG